MPNSKILFRIGQDWQHRIRIGEIYGKLIDIKFNPRPNIFPKDKVPTFEEWKKDLDELFEYYDKCVPFHPGLLHRSW